MPFLSDINQHLLIESKRRVYHGLEFEPRNFDLELLIFCFGLADELLRSRGAKVRSKNERYDKTSETKNSYEFTREQASSPEDIVRIVYLTALFSVKDSYRHNPCRRLLSQELKFRLAETF
jgi:hypothetical protein